MIGYFVAPAGAFVVCVLLNKLAACIKTVPFIGEAVFGKKLRKD